MNQTPEEEAMNQATERKMKKIMRNKVSSDYQRERRHKDNEYRLKTNEVARRSRFRRKLEQEYPMEDLLPTVETLLEESERAQVIWDVQYLQLKDAIKAASSLKQDTQLLWDRLEEFARVDTTSSEEVWLKAVQAIIFGMGTKRFLRHSVTRFLVLIGPSLLQMQRGDKEGIVGVIDLGLMGLLTHLNSRLTENELIVAMVASSYLIALILQGDDLEKFVRGWYRYFDRRCIIFAGSEQLLEFFMISGMLLRANQKHPSVIPFETGIEELFTTTRHEVQNLSGFNMEKPLINFGIQAMEQLLRPIEQENDSEKGRELIEQMKMKLKEYLASLKKH